MPLINRSLPDLVQARKEERKRKDKVKFKSFVNVTLTKIHAAELTAMDLEVEFPWTDLQEVVSDGYKFSMSYSHGDNSYVATLIDHNHESVAAGYALSGWGATPHKAFSALLYKHRYIFQDGWEIADEQRNDSGFG